MVQPAIGPEAVAHQPAVEGFADPESGRQLREGEGLAKFAGKHGHLFHRIQLIRKKPSAGGGTFLRLDLNREAVRNAVLLVTGNPQLDAVFDEFAQR
ncbi:MAG TPA: hypothetical protein VES73_16620 [Lamprocystis sp. (in: g-proteobacteria)]|nr:hypothetical protein [Lamprocystis sp. (in: g-proteobacteria)]